MAAIDQTNVKELVLVTVWTFFSSVSSDKTSHFQQKHVFFLLPGVNQDLNTEM